MNLYEYCERIRRLDFPRFDERAPPPREHVRTLQANMEQALRSDAFLLDCFELELDLFDGYKMRRGVPPFCQLRELGIGLAFIYWAPGQDAGAHEHTAWTVSAVCHNALQVFTYDRHVAYAEGRLLQKNVHPAPAGRVGHIYDPCIHNPHNPTDSWSLSLHVISPQDAKPINAEGLPTFNALRPAPFAALSDDDPYAQCAIARHRESALRVLVEVLSRSRDPRTFSLLERIFVRANVHTKRRVCAVMREIDAARARPWTRSCDDIAIAPSSRIRLVSPALQRETRVEGDRVELVVHGPRGPEVLLRVDAWAKKALDLLAREDEIVVRDLPGGLDDDERLAIVEALEGWCLFTSGERPRAASIDSATT